MKKILLTLAVGFCFTGAALAQEPGKVAKKKGLVQHSTSGDQAAKVKAKLERAKAIESGRSAQPAVSSSKAAKAAVAERAN